jgi:type VI secretion system protein
MASDTGPRSLRRAVLPLLARVRAAHTARDASSDHALRASILQHLQVMCSTRLGSMLVCPDYGLPSVSEMVHSFPDATSAIADALVRTIEKYEPRLTNVRVRHLPPDPSSLVIRFEISAVVRGTGADTPLRFKTSIDASRRVTVE